MIEGLAQHGQPILFPLWHFHIVAGDNNDRQSGAAQAN